MLKTSLISPAIAVVIVVAVSGCGATAPQPAASPTAHTHTRTSTVAGTATKPHTTTSQATAPRTTTTESVPSGPLAFAKCMRAHGVTNFPDPSPGGGFAFKTSSFTTSPVFQTAQARCQTLVSGPALPEFRGNPSKQTMAKLLRIATCMRAHGIHQFPDPLYSRPRHFTPGEYQEITDFDGATLLFPANMDLQAPAYRQALTSCGAPPLGLPH